MAYIGQDIADVAVTVGQGVIDASHIQDSSITTADLGNDAVTPNKIDDDGTGFQMGSLGLGTAVSGSHKLTVGGSAVISGTLQSDDFTLDAGSGNADLVIKTSASSSATAQMLFLTGDKDFTLINDTGNFRLYNSTPGVGVDVIKVIGSSSDILFGDVGNSRHLSLDYSNGDVVANQRLGVGVVPPCKFTVKSGSAGAIASGIGFYNAGDTNLAAAIFEESTSPTSGELRLYSGGAEKVYLRANSSSSNAFLFKGGQMQDITANNTGIQYRANWDTGFLNRIDNNFDGASSASSYMRFKIASGAGSQNTALTMYGDGNVEAGSVMKSPTFRTNTSTTSAANNTWHNVSGLTNLSAGMYLIFSYKDDYNPNAWAASGTVRDSGHSNCFGVFDNTSYFELRTSGSNVQVRHQLGSTFDITTSWIKIG